MNVWENTVLTDKGHSLLAKLIEGHTLDITRAETGSGYVTPGLLAKQESVSEPQQAVVFHPVSYPKTGKCALPCSLTNDNVTTGYLATQLGVYANDPDEGEILFFIAQGPSGKGTEVPSASEMPGYSAEWTFYLQYGQADGVTVVVDPTGAITQEGMEQYIESEILSMTYSEIDAAMGVAGGGGTDTGGDSGSGGNGGSGVATLDHNLLYNRNIPNQHTMEAITGLETALSDVEGDPLDDLSIETAWTNASEDA